MVLWQEAGVWERLRFDFDLSQTDSRSSRRRDCVFHD
jgi:hypothetical protein